MNRDSFEERYLLRTDKGCFFSSLSVLSAFLFSLLLKERCDTGDNSVSGKYKRFKASEAASNDPEARGGEGTALPPGVPSQALRGMERTTR